jgi:hypothetical protein
MKGCIVSQNGSLPVQMDNTPPSAGPAPIDNPSAQPGPVPKTLPAIPNRKSKPKNQKSEPRQRTGAVARLPKHIRAQINEMLDDGLPYRDIIRRLGEHGVGLNDDMLHRWKTGGYQDYLREQRLLAQLALRSDRALALLARPGSLSSFQAAQQIATAQISEAMVALGPDVLREALAANPLNYFRMLNSFTRLINGGLRCERHAAEESGRAAAKHNTPKTKKGMTPGSVREMKQKLKLM